MHSDNQTFQLRLHELDGLTKERVENQKLQLFRTKIEVGRYSKRIQQ